jgi:hypothetical protein
MEQAIVEIKGLKAQLEVKKTQKWATFRRRGI